MSSFLTRSMIAILLVSLLTPASAGLISTAEALDLRTGSAQELVERFLMREEVAAELASLGLSPEQALNRAAALSSEELSQLAGRITDLPAGAGVIEVLGITFLVLIILELIGVIDLFKR